MRKNKKTKKSKMTHALAEYNLDLILPAYGIPTLSVPHHSGREYVLCILLLIAANGLLCTQNGITGWYRILLGLAVYGISTYYIAKNLEGKCAEKRIFLMTLFSTITFVQQIMTAAALCAAFDNVYLRAFIFSDTFLSRMPLWFYDMFYDSQVRYLIFYTVVMLVLSLVVKYHHFYNIKALAQAGADKGKKNLGFFDALLVILRGGILLLSVYPFLLLKPFGMTFLIGKPFENALLLAVTEGFCVMLYFALAKIGKKLGSKKTAVSGKAPLPHAETHMFHREYTPVSLAEIRKFERGDKFCLKDSDEHFQVFIYGMHRHRDYLLVHQTKTDSSDRYFILVFKEINGKLHCEKVRDPNQIRTLLDMFYDPKVKFSKSALRQLIMESLKDED